MEETDQYPTHLEALKLGSYTIKQYLYYYGHLLKVLHATHGELDQEVLEIFVSGFNNGVCRAFLKDYLEYKHLFHLKIPKIQGAKPKKIRSYIDPDEIKTIGKYLFRHYQDQKFYLLLYLNYYCALRRKEVVNITPLDFDWKTWKDEKKGSVRLKITFIGAKRKRERLIIVPPKLTSAIWKYINNNRDKIQASSKPTLFRVDVDRWHKVFKDAVKQSLGKNYVLHDLRYSRATYWNKVKKMDIVKIKKLLGHVDIKTTQRYIDPEQESALKELEESYY